jgi:hypothetical protein
MKNGEIEDSGSRPGGDGEGKKDELIDKDFNCKMRSVNMNTLVIYDYNTLYFWPKKHLRPLYTLRKQVYMISMLFGMLKL